MKRDPKHKAIGDQQIAAEFVGYLIDGQQRLTSLEAAFDLFSGEDKNGSELRCYLDLAATDEERRRVTRIFVSYGGNKSIAWRVEQADSTLIPLRLLFGGKDHDLRKETEEALASLPGWTRKRVGSGNGQVRPRCGMPRPAGAMHDR